MRFAMKTAISKRVWLQCRPVLTQQCIRNTNSFWTEEPKEPIFYELFLESEASGGNTDLFPIPVLCKNLKSASANFPNMEARKRWQLSYRFHLVDRLR